MPFLAILWSLTVPTMAAEHEHQHGKQAKPPVVKAVAVKEIGGWDQVPGMVLRLHPVDAGCKEGHLGEVDARVKAQHTAATIAIRVSWPDASRNDTHKTLHWDRKLGGYVRGKDQEDRLALMFDMGGDFVACMLAGKVFRADVWQWKAARTAPAGLAHDKYHVYSLKPVHKKSKEFVNFKGKKVYIARVSDAGEPLYTKTPKPAARTRDELPGYRVNPKATGSIADVKAKAEHDGKRWVVTFTRKLDTGHDDDVAFQAGKSYKAGLAGFNHSSDMHHSTAGFTLAVE